MSRLTRTTVTLLGGVTAAVAYGWGLHQAFEATSISRAAGEPSILLSRTSTFEGHIAFAETDLCDHAGGVDEVAVQGGAEIVTYDKRTRRLFITHDEVKKVECNEKNEEGENEFEEAIFRGVDVVDIRWPSKPKLIRRIDTSELGRPTSVAVCKNRRFIAVALAADPDFVPGPTGELVAVNGVVGFYNKWTGHYINHVEVGSLPDMITCTPDGRTLLVANEAEPERDNYDPDPEGSVSLINVTHGPRHATVRTANFNKFDSQKDLLMDEGLRIFGPTASVSQDVEPEYIAVSADSSTAWVTLQENNGVAKLDIVAGEITDIFPLGYKDHSLISDVVRNGLDPSNKDGGRIIRPEPVFGMYQPDAVATIEAFGQTFFATANEGDSRDYDGFSEVTRIKDLEDDGLEVCNGIFDESVFTQERLGRLKTTLWPPARGLSDTGCLQELYAYGGRSFTIWTADGVQVYDSGDDFEQISAVAFPENFNSQDDQSSFDDRSDDQGPEPEGIATGVVGDQTYAFVLLERIGGVMVYNVTDPYQAKFVQYINNRDFSNEAGDRAPEGVVFIPAADAPGHEALIAVAHEESGTTTVYRIEQINNRYGH